MLPLTVVPVVASAAVLDAGGGLVTATLIAALVGAVGYTAVFLLLGLFLKNPIVWGLAYILVWEGIAAGLGTGPARLAIRGYTRLDPDRPHRHRAGPRRPRASTRGSSYPCWSTVVALALATWRLHRLDVA